MGLKTLDPSYWYSIAELASIWNVDYETVRRIVIKEPGVKKISNPLPGTKSVRPIYRIPGDVAIRIENRFTVVA